jgi:hypothetical protein
MFVVLEEATSPAEKLWKQLKLLHQLVGLLVVCKGKHRADCMELPSLECNSGNGNRTETADVIIFLQEMDYFAMRNEGTAHSAEVRKYYICSVSFFSQCAHISCLVCVSVAAYPLCIC